MAITDEQLKETIEKMQEIVNKSNSLISCLQIAKKGNVRGIVLTAGQKIILKDRYINEKEEIATLYQELI